MYQEIRDTLGTAYERFLMRDLTYVFAGLIIVTSVKYAYDGKIFDLFSVITKGWTNFILFFLSSYFLGCLTKEALTYWNQEKDNKKVKKDNNCLNYLKYPHWFSTWHAKTKEYYILMFKIQKKFGMSTIRRLERTAYFYHIGASIGTASFVGFLILVSFRLFLFELLGRIPSIEYTFQYASFIIILLLSFGFCLWYNHGKLREYNRHLKYLEEGLKSNFFL